MPLRWGGNGGGIKRKSVKVLTGRFFSRGEGVQRLGAQGREKNNLTVRAKICISTRPENIRDRARGTKGTIEGSGGESDSQRDDGGGYKYG